MTDFINRALFAVADAPGTGSISVGAAVSGPYRTLGAAHDGQTFDIAITDGNAWEVRTGCTYTHGTTTLTRGTLEDSSTGSAISLSASAKVMVTSSAASVAKYDRTTARSRAGFRIVLAVGQSNARGMASTDAIVDVADAAVWQFGCDSTDPARYRIIYRGVDPLAWPETGLNYLSPATWMGRMLARRESGPVLIVPCAFGATGLVGGRWQPGTPGGDLYENAIVQANEAIVAANALYPGSTFEGAYWIQGEKDGDDAISQAAYASALTALIAGFRGRIAGAENSWFVIGSMPYETMQYYPGTQAIYYAQKEVAAQTPRCVFVESPRGQTIAPGSNRHYTAAGIRMIGAWMAAAVFDAEVKRVGSTVPAPQQVTGLAASAVTSSSLSLSWMASPHADTYKVEMSSNGGSSWSAVTRQWGDATTLAISGLTASTSYQFRVSALVCGAAGAASAVLTQSTEAASGVAPSITSQPSASSVSEGATATFSVTASGDAPLSYQWERSTNAGVSWSAISGATGSSYTTPATTISGGDANSSDQYRCVVTNSHGSATSNAASLTVTAASIIYDFESDTVGAAPAGVTAVKSAFEVGSPTVFSGSKAMHTTSMEAVSVSAYARFDAAGTKSNLRCTWRRGRTIANASRDGLVLRIQSGVSVGGTYTDLERGYWFHVDGTTTSGGRLIIYELGASGPTMLGSAYTQAEAADRRYRATANGTALTFEFSNDGGASWTTAVSATSSSYSTGLVGYANGAAASNPSAAWIDNLTIEVL